MRFVLFAALALIVSSAAASAQVREFTRTVELDAGGSLRVVGSKGSMKITAWDSPRVEIRARIERPEDVDDDYAARAVEATRIEVTGDRQSTTVATDYDSVPKQSEWAGGWSSRSVPPVHYEIRAPKAIKLSVDSDRGPAAISGFDGRIDIVLDRGELDLANVSGDVRLEIDRGEQSRIDGVRGSVIIEADRTDLHIDAHALDRDSRIEIDRGDVELRVPEAQRLTVRTDISRRGGFRSDFPIQWTSPDPHHSSGHINGGGAELFVESDRAQIELRRR
jgi:hypothetical protein